MTWNYSGIRQMGLTALDEGRRHVDTDRLDFRRIAAMGAQFRRQAFDDGGVLAFGHEYHRAPLAIGRQCHTIVSPRPRGFVHRQMRHLRIIRFGHRQVHVTLADRRHPVPALARQARHRRKGHLPCQHQHQRLEQQHKPFQAPGPIRLHQPNRTVWQLHPGRAHDQKTLVLEKVQVPIALFHRVMNRMGPFDPTLTVVRTFSQESRSGGT